MSRKFIITIATIFLIAGGFYLYSLYLPGAIERDVVRVTLPPTEPSQDYPLLTHALPSSEAWKEPVDTRGWNTYRNDQYGFEFKYPSDFVVVKGYEGWPHAIVLLECANHLCQTYRLAVEVKDTDQIREANFKYEFLGKKNDNAYIMLTNINAEKKISQVISTFRSL